MTKLIVMIVLILAGCWKIYTPAWTVDHQHQFWSEGGRFLRYGPEFFIAIFNQLLLLAVVLLTFRIAKTVFDGPTAWLAALLVLASDLLWKFSVAGLPVLLLLVIFLGLVWCLISFDAAIRAENPDSHFVRISYENTFAAGDPRTREQGWLDFDLQRNYGLVEGRCEYLWSCA